MYGFVVGIITNDANTNSLHIKKLLWLWTNGEQICIPGVYQSLDTDLYTWSMQTKKHLETATVFAVYIIMLFPMEED